MILLIFYKKKDFDDKLKHLNIKVISNQTKHIVVENKLNYLTKKSWGNINKRKNKWFDKQM